MTPGIITNNSNASLRYRSGCTNMNVNMCVFVMNNISREKGRTQDTNEGVRGKDVLQLECFQTHILQEKEQATIHPFT